MGLRVIINGQFYHSIVTGVQRYAREICRELDFMAKDDEFILALPPETEDVPVFENIRVVKIGKLHNRLWEQVSFRAFVRKSKGIALNLCNVGPLFNPDVVCIHDIKVKVCPQYFNRLFALVLSAVFKIETRRSRRIITVSNFSRNEIASCFNVDKDKITVAPNSWQHYSRLGYDEKALDKYGLRGKKYCYAMSSLEPNKNYVWIARIAEQNPDLTFAVAGCSFQKVFRSGQDFDCPKNMVFLGYVSDSEAKALSRSCRAFLFPTFYEGFGIPPLEAISAGCRCIVVSDTEVMHEVYGTVANYIDPHKYECDLEKLKIMEESEATGVLERYSWKQSAETIYESIRHDYLLERLPE